MGKPGCKSIPSEPGASPFSPACGPDTSHVYSSHLHPYPRTFITFTHLSSFSLFFFFLHLKPSLIHKGPKMLEPEAESGRQLPLPFSKAGKAGGCRSLEVIVLYAQVPPENSNAEHEYVDTQEMTRADVAPISAGPFDAIAANIQHLFWLSRMFL